jgi:hypothetical protein
VPDRYPAIEDHAVIGDLHTVACNLDWALSGELPPP